MFEITTIIYIFFPPLYLQCTGIKPWIFFQFSQTTSHIRGHRQRDTAPENKPAPLTPAMVSHMVRLKIPQQKKFPPLSETGDLCFSPFESARTSHMATPPAKKMTHFY